MLFDLYEVTILYCGATGVAIFEVYAIEVKTLDPFNFSHRVLETRAKFFTNRTDRYLLTCALRVSGSEFDSQPRRVNLLRVSVYLCMCS